MDSTHTPSALSEVLQLAQTCEYDANHIHQVARLALRLFDELQPLHNLGTMERDWLHYAALLHDIGWIEGWKEHHKVSLRIILTTPMLNFSNKERYIVGSIARYHRKALPSLKHAHYATLSESERQIVDILAGILRLADGLDSSHQMLVRDLSVKTTPKKITIHCAVQSKKEEEKQTGIEKADLLQQVFNRTIVLEWKLL
jgi:exopolyphosphatase/guanosine-5'-triphosphate,3'-diphosphate pyrophosphatase